MGSIWGNALKISIFGESHGGGIGVVLDGFPSGIAFDEEFVLSEMSRRAPGKNKQSTARREADRPKVLSGIYQGYTAGTPICARAITRIFLPSRAPVMRIIPVLSALAAIMTHAAEGISPAA